MNINWNLAGAVILSGLVIVFLILILLIWLVGITSKIVNKASSGWKKPSGAVAKAPAAATSKAVAPVVQQGIEEEIVAAISAAVYTCMEASAPGVPFEIRSISHAAGGRPVWGFAGMQQNTRPF